MRCPRCGYTKFWLLSDGRRRCAHCRHDWRSDRMPLRLTAAQWRLVLRWFVRGLPSAQIARETGLDRKRTLRALLVVRRAIGELSPRAPEPVSGRTLLPVLAIYASDEEFWSVAVSGHEAARIERALLERSRLGRELPRMGPYVAVVYRRRLYRLTKPGEERASFGQLEAFWSYLQRQLRSKGGVRRSRLNLYLAEYSWRYNRRKMGPDEQVRELMALVRRARRGVRNVAIPRVLGTSARRPSYAARRSTHESRD